MGNYEMNMKGLLMRLHQNALQEQAIVMTQLWMRPIGIKNEASSHSTPEWQCRTIKKLISNSGDWVPIVVPIELYRHIQHWKKDTYQASDGFASNPLKMNKGNKTPKRQPLKQTNSFLLSTKDFYSDKCQIKRARFSLFDCHKNLKMQDIS